VEVRPTLESLKSFLEEAKLSRKARELGAVSVTDYYEFLTSRKAWTKSFKEPKRCRDWMLNVWRPFSKTLTNEDWKSLGVYPSLGRDGYIAIFTYRGN